MNERSRERRPRLTSALALTLACVAIFTGGSALAGPDDGYAQGWRRARVDAIVDWQAPVPWAYRDCRPTPLTQAADPQRYVMASYAFGGNPNLRHTMVVPLPIDRPFAVGQAIRINITRCDTAMPLESGD